MNLEEMPVYNRPVGVMVTGVDDANFTILEISNEIVTVNANS